MSINHNKVRSNEQDSEKKARQQLISSEYINHVLSIIESSDDAIVYKSLDGTINSWNKGGEKMFGYQTSEVIGKHISLLITPEYIDEDARLLTRVCNNETIDHFETVRLRKNGDRIFVSLSISPLINDDGKIIGASEIMKNITQRKLTERASITTEVSKNVEKESRAAELLKANEELIFQNNEKEKRAAELLIANEELIFQNKEKETRAAELIVANRELAFQNQEKEKRAAELVVANKELLYQNEERKKRAAELAIANEELAFQNKEKEKRAAELILANKELAFQNEEKEKRAAELIIINSELAIQEIKLKKHNKELEQFAYVASHDLQEPLRTVSNYMQVFEEDYLPLLDKRALGYLAAVNSSTERMSTLVKSLLAFSRLGKNSVLKSVDLNVLISEVIADLQTVISESNAEISISEMPVLNVFEIEARQLFQNLIINAIKFQKQNTRPGIQITTVNIDGVHNFSVKDNGIGIDSIHFERIFEIFQRLHTQEKYDGNGIGLANCKKIVQLHEGELNVTSIMNEGTTFHFTLGNLKIK